MNIKKLFIVGFLTFTSFSSFADSLAVQNLVQTVSEGIASGQITDETKDYFLASIASMQNPSAQSVNQVQEFTNLVCSGISSGEITNETRDFFLEAVFNFGKSCD